MHETIQFPEGYEFREIEIPDNTITRDRIAKEGGHRLVWAWDRADFERNLYTRQEGQNRDTAREVEHEKRSFEKQMQYASALLFVTYLSVIAVGFLTRSREENPQDLSTVPSVVSTEQVIFQQQGGLQEIIPGVVTQTPSIPNATPHSTP